MALAFNRSGSRLAAGLTDGNVWIWNTENIDDALVHARVPTRGGGAYAVVFSPDGRHLFGAGPQHRINRWILDGADAKTAIRTAAGGPITAEEWSTLIPTLPYAPPV
jgi:WD40 repeat protein